MRCQHVAVTADPVEEAMMVVYFECHLPRTPYRHALPNFEPESR